MADANLCVWLITEYEDASPYPEVPAKPGTDYKPPSSSGRKICPCQRSSQTSWWQMHPCTSHPFWPLRLDSVLCTLLLYYSTLGFLSVWIVSDGFCFIFRHVPNFLIHFIIIFAEIVYQIHSKPRRNVLELTITVENGRLSSGVESSYGFWA